MTNRRAFVKEIIGNLLVFTVVMSPASLVAHAFESQLRAVLGCLVLAPVFLLLYWIRSRSKAFFLFVISHLLFLCLPAILLLFPSVSLITYLWFQILVLIFVVFSVYCQYKGEPTTGQTPFVVGTGLILGLNLLAGRLQVYGWTPLSIGLELALAAGFLKLVNMQNLDRSLEVLSAARSDMDSEHMFRFHNRLLSGFILFMVSAAALAPSLAEGGLSRLLTTLSQAFLNVLRWIVSLFHREAAVEIPQPTPVQGTAPGMFPMAQRNPSVIAQWVEKIVTILIYVVTIGLLACLIAYILFRFYKSFAVKVRRNGDVVETLRRVDHVIRLRRRAFFRDFGQGAEKKIRKLYFRTVSRQKKVSVRQADSARDIQEKLSPHMDIVNLTDAYEKARYGTPLN